LFDKEKEYEKLT